MEFAGRVLEKTEAGRREVGVRTSALERRTRTLLIMVDGQADFKTLLERAAQIGANVGDLDVLLRDGYIRPIMEEVPSVEGQRAADGIGGAAPIDGGTKVEPLSLLAHATKIGAKVDDLMGLVRDGYIRRRASIQVQAADETRADAATAYDTKPKAESLKQSKRRSLALARLYLIGVMERMLGASDHPVRALLKSATDTPSLARAFEDCLVIMREIATPSMVAHVETSFRDLMPEAHGVGISGASEAT
ncbi:hypothetical protein [Cupriavidus basilensis]|uniref:hypothetical protein n=1 Tax=Cupriavidus basilensis TaxID=68895 RepID=UPI000696F209|nr:hypothetical protein [Cupriavidus basilensis]